MREGKKSTSVAAGQSDTLIESLSQHLDTCMLPKRPQLTRYFFSCYGKLIMSNIISLSIPTLLAHSLHFTWGWEEWKIQGFFFPLFFVPSQPAVHWSDGHQVRWLSTTFRLYFLLENAAVAISSCKLKGLDTHIHTFNSHLCLPPVKIIWSLNERYWY